MKLKISIIVEEIEDNEEYQGTDCGCGSPDCYEMDDDLFCEGVDDVEMYNDLMGFSVEVDEDFDTAWLDDLDDEEDWMYDLDDDYGELFDDLIDLAEKHDINTDNAEYIVNEMFKAVSDAGHQDELIKQLLEIDRKRNMAHPVDDTIEEHKGMDVEALIIHLLQDMGIVKSMYGVLYETVMGAPFGQTVEIKRH